MFGIGYSELLLIAVVGLVVIGPKDLPRVMRQVGRWVGRAQGMARHFRSGIDAMIRESELEEMETKWREENERIMREHPLLSSDGVMMPVAPPPPPATSEPDWEPQVAAAPGIADTPAVPEAAAPEAAPPEALGADPSAPELPLGPPAAAPGRELP
jgi:sec-independent protein translocase protein TatB